MKKSYSNKSKFAGITLKIALSAGILLTTGAAPALATQSSTYTAIHLKSQEVRATIPTSIAEARILPEAIKKEDAEIRRLYRLNQFQLFISYKHSQTLLNEYAKYKFQTPISQRDAGNFYAGLYFHHPEMEHQIKEDGFDRGARGIIYSTKDHAPTTQAAKELFKQQSSLANQYMLYFDILKEHVRSNGDSKYSKSLLTYNPRFKSNLY